MPGANSKGRRGGRRPGAGRPDDVELRRMVVDLATSLGYQGDARVQTDRIVDGQVVRGQPWSREEDRGIKAESIRDAARSVARRRLADQPLEPKARARAEETLADRIRRAYYRAEKEQPLWAESHQIEVGPSEGVASVAVLVDDELDTDDD